MSFDGAKLAHFTNAFPGQGVKSIFDEGVATL
jgi:hypothetical protein